MSNLEKVREVIESQYIGTCTIKELQTNKNPVTKIDESIEVEIAKDFTEKCINKNQKNGLIITGKSGVGKTHLATAILNKLTEKDMLVLMGRLILLLDVIKDTFKDFSSKEKDIIELYKSNMSSDEKFLKLKAYINLDIEKENTCLFIDEIQESEELISELKYFCEKHQNVKIICSGSLLGIKFKRF